MAGLIALIVSSLIAWIAHALVGEHVSMMSDFAITTVLGGAAYVAVFYWLKKLRGG